MAQTHPDDWPQLSSSIYYADAHCARARAAGAKIHQEPKTTDYGEDYWADRSYEAEDPEGHRWWITQRVREPKKKA